MARVSQVAVLAGSLAGAAVAGCNGDSTGPRNLKTLADLAGTWDLSAWEAVSVADTTQRLDLRAVFTAVATLEVAADGAGTFTSSVYRQTPTIAKVTISLAADTLIYHELTGDSRFLLSGTFYHMVWRGVIPQYQDVNGDGVPEETRTRLEFNRR